MVDKRPRARQGAKHAEQQDKKVERLEKWG